jgi:hypothetical protein
MFLIHKQHVEFELKHSRKIWKKIILENKKLNIQVQLVKQDFELNKNSFKFKNLSKHLIQTWIIFKKFRTCYLWKKWWIKFRSTSFWILKNFFLLLFFNFNFFYFLPNVFVNLLRLLITPCIYCLLR